MLVAPHAGSKMPKSKRELKITLSQTQKKGHARKAAILEEVRSCVDQYTNLFVFSAENIRNAALKGIRAALRSSRVFFGRTKLISAALGRTPSDEFRDGLSEVAGLLKGGEMGIIFTNENRETIERVFLEGQVPEYARAGFEAPDEVTLSAGPLPNFPHNMEPYLRKLGLPTRLINGVVTLAVDYTVCREGEELTSEQCKLLQLLNMKTSIFELSLVAGWSGGSLDRYSAD